MHIDSKPNHAYASRTKSADMARNTVDTPNYACKKVATTRAVRTLLQDLLLYKVFHCSLVDAWSHGNVT